MADPAQPAILGEGRQWLIIDKPAGWHSVAVRTSDGAPTIQDWLASTQPEQAALPEAGLVQRLDRWTSGCILAGRTPEAVERLRARLAGVNDLRKTYLALVTPGVAAHGAWTLHFSSRHRGSEKVTVGRRGDERTRGECRWTVKAAADPAARRRAPSAATSPTGDLGRGRGSAPSDRGEPPTAFDLLEIELVGPGRRHQIRAGFASLGHPLAGDGLYGGRPLRIDAEGPPFENRPALHAFRLELDGVCLESPLPAWALLATALKEPSSP